jgi:hypothetical protein
LSSAASARIAAGPCSVAVRLAATRPARSSVCSAAELDLAWTVGGSYDARELVWRIARGAC